MATTVILDLIAAGAVAVFVVTFRYGYLPQTDEMHEFVRTTVRPILDTLRVCLFIGFVTVLITDEPFIRRNWTEAPPYPDRAHPCEDPGSTVFPLCSTIPTLGRPAFPQGRQQEWAKILPHIGYRP